MIINYFVVDFVFIGAEREKACFKSNKMKNREVPE